MHRTQTIPILVCISSVLLMTSPVFAQSEEESYPPVLRVESASIYKKGTNSIHDEAGIEKSKEQLEPVDSFMGYLSKAVDKATSPGELSSQYKQLRHWAKSGALLQPPDTPGRVARVWIASGMGLLILKFKMRGVHLTPDVVNWYAQLAGAVYDDYSKPLQKGGYKGLYSNVFPWAGASMGIVALLTDDPEAKHAQERAWDIMNKEIQPDGTLTGEAQRGRMALGYHMRTADGLILLRAVRHALGLRDRPAQIESLQRLLEMIGNSLNHPDHLAKLAGAQQEAPGEWAFRIPFAMALDLLPNTWSQYCPEVKSWGSPEYGGDAKLAAQAIAAAAVDR